MSEQWLCEAKRDYLRAHEDEAECVNSTHEGVQDPGVPRLVCLVLESIYGIPNHYRVQRIAEVHHGFLVILLCLCIPALQLCVFSGSTVKKLLE